MTSPTFVSRITLVMALAAALPLGGCKKDKEPGQASAAGEILPRSVADDMLPYDTVRSQPSLANPEADNGPGVRAVPASTPSEDSGTSEAPAAAGAPAEGGAQAGPVTPAAE